MVKEADIYAPAYANETDACMDLKVKITQGKYILKPQEIKKLQFSTIIQQE